MSQVKLRKFRALNKTLPGPVELRVSDHDEPGSATVWIEAKFHLDLPKDADAMAAFVHALTTVQELSGIAKENLGSVHYL